MSESKNVSQCIAEVQSKIAKSGISKDRTNEQQRYKFRGIDDVYNALSSIMAEVGLVILPSYPERTITEREAKSGGVLFCVVVKGNYTLISAHDGSEKATGPFWGEAMDSADKATNKAMSAAYKYMAMQVFAIPTEGDNDADAQTPAIKTTKANIRPAGGVMESLPADDQTQCRLVASIVLDAWDNGKQDLAVNNWKEHARALGQDERVAAWDLLPSNVRSHIKKVLAQSGVDSKGVLQP